MLTIIGALDKCKDYTISIFRACTLRASLKSNLREPVTYLDVMYRPDKTADGIQAGCREKLKQQHVNLFRMATMDLGNVHTACNKQLNICVFGQAKSGKTTALQCIAKQMRSAGRMTSHEHVVTVTALAVPATGGEAALWAGNETPNMQYTLEDFFGLEQLQLLTKEQYDRVIDSEEPLHCISRRARVRIGQLKALLIDDAHAVNCQLFRLIELLCRLCKRSCASQTTDGGLHSSDTAMPASGNAIASANDEPWGGIQVVSLHSMIQQRVFNHKVVCVL